MEMAETPILKIQDLQAGYGEIRVLKGVNLSVQPGEIVTLIGANGAGKTTTLRVISGILKKMEGGIWFQGEPVDLLPPHIIVKKGLIHIREGRGIFKTLTVLDNLRMGAFTRKEGDLSSNLDGVYALFPRLKERERQMAGSLSGGEQQMLALGRAMMAEPKLLLMDEPSLGLAPLLINETFKLIGRIHERNISILLVEQNARKALQVAQRGFVLENGKIVMEGNPQDLLDNQEVKRAYLGNITGLRRNLVKDETSSD
jgi:branched-chain amino acid transport system ATP-binding protein